MQSLGLTSAEVETERREYGFNEIKELNHVSPLKILLRQVKGNFLVYLLIIAALLALLVGEHGAAYTIMAIIFMVVGVSFFQEYKAEQAIKLLREMIVPVSTVIRNGKEHEIFSRELVPGDLLLLRTGEKVPADCVAVEQNELSLDESILTGESKAVEKKNVKDIKHYKTENLLLMGSLVLSGKCSAVVVHTGMNTEFGRIAGMISTAEKELPLREKVNGVAKFMVVVALVFAVLVGIIIGVRSYPLSYDSLLETVLVAVALAVSAFPESFPVVLTATLASGAYQMAKRNAIVNRMSTIETLGETTVICADKTGTITKGEMTVKKILVNDKIVDVTGVGYETGGKFVCGKKLLTTKNNSTLELMLKTAVLCNDATIEKKGTDEEYDVYGSPTEAALLIMAAKAGIFKENLLHSRTLETPFSSERKAMYILSGKGDTGLVYAKGAPEVIISKCAFVMNNGKKHRLTAVWKKKILDTNNSFTRKGYRTIALAYKEYGRGGKHQFEDNLVFLGITAMEDPPRPEVKSAIAQCKTAGIDVKMITGDNGETAAAISREIGISGESIDGYALDEMTDDELYNRVGDISIFSRVRPEHKLRIVKALKRRGAIVTMTGDGVNDAPALKEAHIGVAMGKRGTDVSRDASDLILKDDNFSTIVSAISEGRRIFNNIRKFITYQLSCNYAELLIIFIGIVIGFPLPLLALQILFMNLVTDDLPAITLGFGASPGNIMLSQPRKNSSIINAQLLVFIIVSGTVMMAGTLAVFAYSLYVADIGLMAARTLALVTLILFEIANAFNFRSFRKPVYRSKILENKYLVYAAAASILATLAVVYTPIKWVFSAVPIPVLYWAVAISVSLSVIIAVDILKRYLLSGKLLEEYL